MSPLTISLTSTSILVTSLFIPAVDVQKEGRWGLRGYYQARTEGVRDDMGK